MTDLDFEYWRRDVLKAVRENDTTTAERLVEEIKIELDRLNAELDDF